MYNQNVFPCSLCLLVYLSSASGQEKSVGPVISQDQNGFVRRFITFYHNDWFTKPADTAPPARRGLPQPLDSPPFPSADWSYGGSPVIGESDTNSYPLMSAINGGRGRTKLYGWVEPTVNGSTSAHSNAPEANYIYPNQVELNQAVIYLERLPDTVQRDHIDIGYHLTGLYGTDYRYTTDKGYFSSQFVQHGYQYGFDPSMEYVDVYLPKVAQGMNIRIGRFISVPGIEAQLSPNNYFFSHSLLYGVDPFTDTGIMATVQTTFQSLIQIGVTASHDVAPWTSDAKPSLTACFSHSTRSVNDNVYLCANGINDGQYAFNNVQQYDGTWYHRFSKHWHSATEAYVMYQRNVPSVAKPNLIEAGTSGAVCLGGHTRCLAPEWAIVNYINMERNGRDFLGFRSDLLNDKKGQRTGYQTKYTENTLSFSRWVGSTVQVRPEVRFDHAWDRNAYDRGTRQSQFTVASDLIFHF